MPISRHCAAPPGLFRRTGVLFCFLLAQGALMSGCQPPDRTPDKAGFAAAAPRLNEVLVLGMIHGTHRSSEAYGLAEVRRIVKAVDPDFILTEIPPERLEEALRSYAETGVVSEERVARFPEYTDAIIPLMADMKFEIVACAGWTKEMALERRAKLKNWETSRQAETEEVERAQALAGEAMESEGLDDTPRGIHSQRYDALVKQAMEPYDRLFNEDLGAGGWTNINASHYALIAKALEEHRGEGKRFLVTFGAWHKYWFLEQLAERDDVSVLSFEDFAAEAVDLESDRGREQGG